MYNIAILKQRKYLWTFLISYNEIYLISFDIYWQLISLHGLNTKNSLSVIILIINICALVVIRALNRVYVYVYTCFKSESIWINESFENENTIFQIMSITFRNFSLFSLINF